MGGFPRGCRGVQKIKKAADDSPHTGLAPPSFLGKTYTASGVNDSKRKKRESH